MGLLHPLGMLTSSVTSGYEVEAFSLLLYKQLLWKPRAGTVVQFSTQTFQLDCVPNAATMFGHGSKDFVRRT